MGLSIVKSFSILVASGNGHKCNGMRSALQSNLIALDEQTGLSKVFLHKQGSKNTKYKEDCDRVSREVGQIVQEALTGVSAYFYGSDKKINLSEQN